jgi:chemosensory pili system protein ChpA (sensor histidine kinase/response regulator)
MSIADNQGVLVVDDNAQVRRLLTIVLEREGWPIWSAESGTEAIEQYQKFREHIGAVLLDAEMPGLDGPGTLAALQQVNPHVRVVFLCDNTGDYDVELLRALGARAITFKPLDLAGLVGTVRAVLAGDIRDTPSRQ